MEGNHEMVQKMLHDPLVFLSEGPYTGSLLENNFGCTYLMSGKSHMAIHSFQKAFKKHQESFTINQEAKSSLRARIKVKNAEILYNLALACLHSGQLARAFNLFHRVGPFFKHNPRFWLHLGECCLAKHLKREELAQELFKPNPSRNDLEIEAEARRELVKAVVETDQVKRLKEPWFALATQPQKAVIESPSSRLTLTYSAQCLRNVVKLVRDLDGDNKGKETVEDESGPLLKAVSLIKLSFVCLKTDDFVNAIENARDALRLASDFPNQIPGGYKVLGRLYLAQGLVQMNKVDEAIKHLKPADADLCDVNFRIPIKGAKSAEKSKKASAPVKFVFGYNLIVAELTKKNPMWDQAEHLLNHLWRRHVTTTL